MSIYGISVSSQADLINKITQFQGTPPEIRAYLTTPPDATFWTNWTDGLADAKMLILSFKSDLASFAAGAYDTQMSAFLAGVPNGLSVYLVCYHEPEDNIALGQITLADWQAANHHMMQLLQPHKPIVRPAVILMGYTLLASSGRNPTDYLVAGIKHMFWDIYPTDKALGGLSHGLPSPASFLDLAQPFCAAHNKHWGLAEFGSHTISDSGYTRAEWFTDVANYVSGAGGSVCSLFTGANAPTGSFDLTGDQASIDSWKAVMGI